ncbi:MAG: RNA ligase [Dehalococcoidales bacterium]|jgi:putative ATP-dependent DNA ligase|nr:RNA ligase [Dehalococcoidales bacterium]
MLTEKVIYEERQYQGIRYRRLSDDCGKMERGTVWLLDDEGRQVLREIPAFPHISRIYRLDRGIQRVFGSERFFAEEKLDGYNLRIVLFRGQLLAFTKGGFLCPFSTDWAEIWADKQGIKHYLIDNPDHIICGEVVGDNPYNHQRDPVFPKGAHLFVFDIRTPDGNFLPPEQRYRLAERYSLNLVPVYGEYTLDKMEQLRQLLTDLHQRGREGVVLKSAAGNRVIKFVTPAKDLEDIRDGLIIGFDLPPNFFRNRLLRIGLFVHEFGLDKATMALEIGRACLEGFRQLERFHESCEEYLVYVRDLGIWGKTRELIEEQTRVITDEIVPDRIDGYQVFRIKFRRRYRKSTHRFHSMLKGFTFVD